MPVASGGGGCKIKYKKKHDADGLIISEMLMFALFRVLAS